MKAYFAAVLTAAAFALALPAQAQTVVTQITYRSGGPGWHHGWHHGGRHGGHHGHGHGHGRWAAPLLGAVVIGGLVYANRPQVYAEPVYINAPPTPPRVAYLAALHFPRWPRAKHPSEPPRQIIPPSDLCPLQCGGLSFADGL
jgi:hypothetical protein